jgi:AcrR family transcriptional regulator
MSNKTTLTPKGRRTRAAILKAARNILRSEGLDGLSLRKVAGKIDYTATAIYEYFSGKDALIDALCDGADRRLAEYLRDVPAELPVDKQLIEMGMAYIRFAVDNQEEFLILFSGPNEPQTESQEPGSSFMVLFDAIRVGIEAGVFRTNGMDPFMVSYTAWAYVHGMATLRLTALIEAQVDFDAANRWGLERYVAGLMK